MARPRRVPEGPGGRLPHPLHCRPVRVHGVLLFVVSRDPVRYRGIVRYLGWMNVLFGLLLVLIDMHAGMPLLWTLLEGPPVTGFGVVLRYLSRHL